LEQAFANFSDWNFGLEFADPWGCLKLAKFAGLIWEMFLIRRVLGYSEPNFGLRKSPKRRP
jgi:hypothetical protein